MTQGIEIDSSRAIKALVGKSIREVEMMLIESTLEKVNGNRIKAAAILKVTDRTLRNKLNPKREKKIENAANEVAFDANINPENINENPQVNSNTNKTYNADY